MENPGFYFGLYCSGAYRSTIFIFFVCGNNCYLIFRLQKITTKILKIIFHRQQKTIAVGQEQSSIQSLNFRTRPFSEVRYFFPNVLLSQLPTVNLTPVNCDEKCLDNTLAGGVDFHRQQRNWQGWIITKLCCYCFLSWAGRPILVHLPIQV